MSKWHDTQQSIFLLPRIPFTSSLCRNRVNYQYIILQQSILFKQLANQSSCPRAWDEYYKGYYARESIMQKDSQYSATNVIAEQRSMLFTIYNHSFCKWKILMTKVKEVGKVLYLTPRVGGCNNFVNTLEKWIRDLSCFLFSTSFPANTHPRLIPHTTTMSDSRIYSAVYSGVAVYETVANDVAVMRRRNDSYMNATQILKVAGIEKGKRTKILEREVLIGEHEKVQGGYGKFQGTW